MLRGLGPAMPPLPWPEILRAATGAALGLLLTDLTLWLLNGAEARGLAHLALVAPFGASAYLLFSLPNSPLAQPWSAVAGNTLSALSALAVLALGLPALAAMALAVLAAMTAMALARAMHPPGGAVAVATVLLADQTGAAPGWAFAFHPILTGTATLVASALLWNRLTGRAYPFRQPAPGGATAPDQRLGPGPLALASALGNLRMGANLGVADLSRLIAAAETLSAAQNRGPMTAGRIMTRDLTTLSPATPLPEAARLFRQTGFRHLPLVGPDGFLGLVPQIALLGPLPQSTLAELADPVASLPSDTPLADVLSAMSSGGQLCLPVVDQGRLQGLITRSDLLAALTHTPEPTALTR